jgi:uncharacterized protein (UPF0548 family)
MADARRPGSPAIQRRLKELATKQTNFDPSVLGTVPPPAGWTVDDIRRALRRETPGPPAPGGSWEAAKRLIGGYDFADPSIVRAYYDPDQPLAGRDMLLRLQALGLFHLFVGVRVNQVFDETREQNGRRAQVWGWDYRTLEGHVERGQMAWEVWKWLDSGEVDFRVYSISRPAHIRNPIVRIGFRLLSRHERSVFLRSTGERMHAFTELVVDDDGAGSLRDAAANLTARPYSKDDQAHEQLARSADHDPTVGRSG